MKMSSSNSSVGFDFADSSSLRIRDSFLSVINAITS